MKSLLFNSIKTLAMIKQYLMEQIKQDMGANQTVTQNEHQNWAWSNSCSEHKNYHLNFEVTAMQMILLYWIDRYFHSEVACKFFAITLLQTDFSILRKWRKNHPMIDRFSSPIQRRPVTVNTELIRQRYTWPLLPYGSDSTWNRSIDLCPWSITLVDASRMT